ncbi:unnamed protein product [Oikopleura dioica]|uniref:Uncharacterized protein n=1 Tax=Oikopleura dioica TaxID=34765 RepID=E4XP81_OIKDI|nr:unnamed protein product [Oikopleura dioica]
MSHALSDLKNSAKMIKALRTPSEVLRNERELGVNGEQAVRILVDLEEELKNLSNFPSLMGEEAWKRMHVIEQKCSRALAVQAQDEFITTNGRRKRVAKVAPALVWNFHSGVASIFVKLVSAPGETFVLAKGCWEGDGYPGDYDYNQDILAKDQSIISFNEELDRSARVEIESSEEEVPSLEELFEEPCTSAAAEARDVVITSKKSSSNKKIVVEKASKKSVLKRAKRGRRERREIIKEAEQKKSRTSKRVKK